MPEVEIIALSKDGYKDQLKTYYERFNNLLSSNEISKEKKLKSKRSKSTISDSADSNWFSISPEFGLQENAKQADGSIKVEEIRLPILVDGNKYLNDLNVFITNYKLNHKFNELNTELLKTSTGTNISYTRYIINVENITSQKMNEILPELRKFIKDRLKLDTNIVVDIYTWSPVLQLIVNLENIEPDTINDQLIKTINEYLHVNGFTCNINIADQSFINTASENRVSEENQREFSSLQQLNKIIYQLLNNIRSKLNDTTAITLINDNYENDFYDIKNNNNLSKYLAVIRDAVPHDEGIKDFIISYFQELKTQLHFNNPNRNNNIGALINYKGQFGIILEEASEKYKIKLYNRESNILTVNKGEVKLRTSIQNKIYNIINNDNNSNNYIDISDDAPIIETLIDLLLANKIIDGSEKQSLVEVFKIPLIDNMIDSRIRPYSINYNISDKKTKNNAINIMGCIQSLNKKTNLVASSRPKRTKKARISNPLHKVASDKINDIYLDLTSTHDKFSKEITPFNVVDSLDYISNLSGAGIILNSDIIIILSSFDRLGTVEHENITNLKDYYQLRQTDNWRNHLLNMDSNHSFFLNGIKWTSINQCVYFSLIDPLFINTFPNIDEEAKYDYQIRYNYGITISGDVTLPNLQARFQYNEPEYSSMTLNDLNSEYTGWLINIGSELRLDFNDDMLSSYGELTFKNFILKRAYYAKFSQNQNAKNLLLATGKSTLYNKEYNSYTLNNSLIETRYYVTSPSADILLYNQIKEKELSDTTEFKNIIIDGIKKYIKKNREIPNEATLIDNISIILGNVYDSKDHEIVTKYANNLAIVLQSNDLIFQQTLETIHADDKEVDREYDNFIKEKYNLGKTRSDKLANATSRFKLFTEVQIDTLNAYLTDKHLISYDVPPDGDCLFHSLVDQLFYNGYYPLNTTGHPQYNMDMLDKELSLPILGTTIIQKTFVEAQREMRFNIAHKIQVNKDSIYIDSEMTVETIVNANYAELQTKTTEQDDRDHNLQTDFERYLFLLQKSASADKLESGKQTGIWGGELELFAASALFGINISNYKLDIGGNLINRDDCTIRCETSRRIFSEGKTYNRDVIQGDINIAWLALESDNAHYISLRNKSDCLTYKVTEDKKVIRIFPDDIFLLVGDNFNQITGTFNKYLGAEIRIIQNVEDYDTFYYFKYPMDQNPIKLLHYYGRTIGKESDDDHSGIDFL